jgi:hypothetical protein
MRQRCRAWYSSRTKISKGIAENGNDWAIRGQLLFKLPSGSELLLNAHASREDVHAGSWEDKGD